MKLRDFIQVQRSWSFKMESVVCWHRPQSVNFRFEVGLYNVTFKKLWLVFQIRFFYVRVDQMHAREDIQVRSAVQRNKRWHSGIYLYILRGFCVTDKAYRNTASSSTRHVSFDHISNIWKWHRNCVDPYIIRTSKHVYSTLPFVCFIYLFSEEREME